MTEAKMDESRFSAQRQTALLEELLAEIKGLRADMNSARKEATELGMQKAMEQMKGMFKGTPLEGMIAKMGGHHG